MSTIYKTVREYIDLDMAFTKHPVTMNVGIKKNVNAVKQSVINLLLLKEGDKPYHPEIKSPIGGFLFENASTVTKILMESEIIKYLDTYEPRIRNISCEVTFTGNNDISVNVSGEIINIEQPFTVNILVSRIR